MYAAIRVLVALLASAAAVAVQAAPITYTISTTATGMLGSSPFTNAPITVTLTGDTSAVTPGTGELASILLNHGSATVNIAGLGSAALTGSIVVLSTFTNTTIVPGQSGAVIAQEDAGHPPNSSVTGIVGILSPAFFAYDLRIALGPVSGSGGVANEGAVDGFFPTTRGNLVFAAGQAFAGTSTFTAQNTAAITPVAGVWWNKSEPGSGFGLDYLNGTLLVEVYSYLAGGPSQWYLAAGALTNNVFTATLDKYVNGQCVSCAYKAPSLAGNDGTITITFTSPTTATADLPGGRHIQIERYFQSAPVAGAFIPVPGVWWNKNEPGSGFGLDYENGTLLVEVYSYLAGGPSQWYLAAGALTNNVFTATLDKYVNGQCVSCAYKAPSLAGNDGTITITFTSPTTATADLPGGRHIAIERYFQP